MIIIILYIEKQSSVVELVSVIVAAQVLTVTRQVCEPHEGKQPRSMKSQRPWN